MRDGFWRRPGRRRADRDDPYEHFYASFYGLDESQPNLVSASAARTTTALKAGLAALVAMVRRRGLLVLTFGLIGVLILVVGLMVSATRLGNDSAYKPSLVGTSGSPISPFFPPASSSSTTSSSSSSSATSAAATTTSSGQPGTTPGYGGTTSYYVPPPVYGTTTYPVVQPTTSNAPPPPTRSSSSTPAPTHTTRPTPSPTHSTTSSAPPPPPPSTTTVVPIPTPTPTPSPSPTKKCTVPDPFHPGRCLVP